MGKIGFVKDSKGRSHHIIYQTYGTTCGPACAAMLEYYYRPAQACTKDDAEERIMKLVGWQEGVGTSRGTLAEGINKKLKIPCELLVVDPKRDLFDTLKRYVTWRTPAIVELDHSWQSIGHYVLCRVIDDNSIGVFLDPVKGLVESKKHNLPLCRFNEMGKFLFSGGIIVSLIKS